MSEKQYVIREGMLKAALSVYDPANSGYTPLVAKGERERNTGRIAEALEAALRWLDGELAKSDGQSPSLGGTYQDGWIGAWRHIRRTFFAPQPEVPEAIKDLIMPLDAQFIESHPAKHSDRNWAVLEAYRRGLAAAQRESGGQ